MKKYTVTVTMTHTRTYVFDAETELQAQARAYDWAEAATGECPPGCDLYTFQYTDNVEVHK